MAAGKTYEIATFQDIVRLYADLPEARGELMLKEVGDAVRMLAPLIGVVSLAQPLRWIDADDSKATLNLVSKPGDEPLLTITAKLPRDAN